MDEYVWGALGARAEGTETGEVSIMAALDASDKFQFRSNTTSELINELQFQAARSVRASVITTASFNVFAAVVTLACALWDCWVRAKRDNPSLTWKYGTWKRITQRNLMLIDQPERYDQALSGLPKSTLLCCLVASLAKASCSQSSSPKAYSL